MERFETEEQQVEAIKRFWKENGIAILIGAVLGLGGLWGWRYYNQEQINAKEQASIAYQEAVDALAADASGYTDMVNFINDNPSNGYSALAQFQLAKEAVERSDLPEAAKQLGAAASITENSVIRNVANIRLARVQIELEQLDQALSTLALVTDEAFISQVQENKGDIYVRQQLFDKARAAYSAALEKNATNNVLKMKLDNLAVLANG